MIDFTKFGLAPEDTAATLIHPMCADQFTAWRDRASPAQKEWVTATGFAAKPATPSVLSALTARLILPLVSLAAMQFGMRQKLPLPCRLQFGSLAMTTAAFP